jgi:hypothetical protein
MKKLVCSVAVYIRRPMGAVRLDKLQFHGQSVLRQRVQVAQDPVEAGDGVRVFPGPIACDKIGPERRVLPDELCEVAG